MHQRGEQEADKLYPLNSGVTGVVVTRKASDASTSSAGSRRPASVVIHDNEELLRLADELHSQGMRPEERPKSSSASNLVRRNSSGYSSSGSRDRLSKMAAVKASQSSSNWSAKVSQSPPNFTNGPARPPQSPIRSRSYKGATSAVLNKVRAAESHLDPRRSSMCAVGEFRPRTSATQTTNRSQVEASRRLFGSGSKKGQSEVKGQEKVMRRQKSHDTSEAKRAAFLQNRSSTGLNLFGLGHKRRSSVAVRATDDAALTVGGMRPAKSSANILQQLGSPSPSKKKQQGAAAAGHTVCLSQG